MNINFIRKILFIILLYIILFCIFHTDYINYNKIYNLKKDGCCIFKNIFNKEDICSLKNLCQNNNYEDVKKICQNNIKLKNLISETLGDGYIFQDYIFIIKKSSVHTCHRDYNGDFFNIGQKFPSYTILIYLEEMEKCLGIIPNSHKDVNSYNINLINKVENLICNPGDIILFDSNLIHVGATNKRDDNLRLQMKITHREDIDVLNYYENYNKLLNQDNVLPKPVIRFQKNFTCMFPFIANLTQNDSIETVKKHDKGKKSSFFQKLYTYLFYGNSYFYDLPDAY